ncbi:MAG: hypothetical protein QOI20_3294 [Acidimicrobiaceae bacterium]|jgi:hypothetical protein|nr:hypothetical protein [Acidimicrobiaceae bacterium]
MSDPTGKALSTANIAIDALRLLGVVVPLPTEVVNPSLVGRVYAFVHAVVAAVEAGMTRKLTPDEVRAELVRLRADIERERAEAGTIVHRSEGRDATVDAAMEAARRRIESAGEGEP